MAPLRRLLTLLTQVAVFLPLVTVTPCGGNAPSTFRMVDLGASDSGWPVWLAAVLAAGFLARPVAVDTAVGDACRAIGAWIGLAVVFACVLSFSLFSSDVQPEVGIWVGGGSWGGLWALCLLSAGLATWRELAGRDATTRVASVDRWLLGLLVGLPALAGLEVGLDGEAEPLAVPAAVGGLALTLLPFGMLAATTSARVGAGARRWHIALLLLVAAAWVGLGAAGLQVSGAFLGLGALGAVTALGRLAWRVANSEGGDRRP